MRAFLAVPARDFADAKHRLAGLLAPAERAALARAMLEDVLAAAGAAPLAAVSVVTRDPEVIACAGRFPVEVLTEAANRGHSEAVALAQAAAVARGADAFLTVPGDVPALTAAELGALVEAGGAARSAVFVPSVSGYGTNGALLRPPDAMTLKFGEPSFANHLSAARARHLATTALRLPGLALDIDTPDDLRALLERDTPTRAGRLLAEWGLRERLGAG
jgi:2-phospho-L-lactate guanylyltransferase